MTFTDTLRHRAADAAVSQLDEQGRVLDAAVGLARRQVAAQEEMRQLQEPARMLARAPDTGMQELLARMVGQMEGLCADLRGQQQNHAQEVAQLWQELETLRAEQAAQDEYGDDGNDEDGYYVEGYGDEGEAAETLLPLPDAVEIARQGDALCRMLVNMNTDAYLTFEHRFKDNIKARYSSQDDRYRGEDAAKAIWEYGYFRYRAAKK